MTMLRNFWAGLRNEARNEAFSPSSDQPNQSIGASSSSILPINDNSGGEFAYCPVCNLQFPKASIDQHAWECFGSPDYRATDSEINIALSQQTGAEATNTGDIGDAEPETSKSNSLTASNRPDVKSEKSVRPNDGLAESARKSNTSSENLKKSLKSNTGDDSGSDILVDSDVDEEEDENQGKLEKRRLSSPKLGTRKEKQSKKDTDKKRKRVRAVGKNQKKSRGKKENNDVFEEETEEESEENDESDESNLESSSEEEYEYNESIKRKGLKQSQMNSRNRRKNRKARRVDLGDLNDQETAWSSTLSSLCSHGIAALLGGGLLYVVQHYPIPWREGMLDPSSLLGN